MALHRRTALQAAGTAALASLSGCSAITDLFGGSEYEYRLTVLSTDESLVERALFEPSAESAFEGSTRAALDAILPDGRHTTHGYEPLPSNLHVEHDGRYFEIKVVVTGRQEMERKLVRAEPIDSALTGEAARDGNGAGSSDTAPIDDGRTGDDIRHAEDLPVASRRVVQLLHAYHSAGGGGSAAEEMRDDAYVLRRPAELDGPIAGDLDGEVVSFDSEGPWAYLITVEDESITETVYESFAVEVARNREQFHDVALATQVDTTLDRSTLGFTTRDLLETTIDEERYSEETPLSDSFSELIEALGLGHVTVGESNLYLWYDDELYRYSLYVHPLD